MGLSRRDFFTLGLGAAAAIPLTPMPWKLLDDTAKWSQNWSWIPRPPRGERSVRFGTCTLCPAGCGIQARCVGKNLIGIAPVKEHPVSKGVLCPYAFGAHQLPYHLSRILQPLRKGNPVALDVAAAEIGRRARAGTVAILDERPGRAVSAAYQRIVTARGGLYVTADRIEATTLQVIARNSGFKAAELGLDLENVRTIVSFGAPLLESWATPGRILTLWKEKRLNIVQVEPTLSKTAALASQWIPEASLGSVEIRGLRERGPLLAVSGGGLPDADEQAVAALNEGSCGIVRRTGGPAIAATSLRDVPNGSIDVLFIDHGPLGGSVPFDALRPKLRGGGIIVSLTPYRAGVAALADYVIPGPAFAESIDEAPTPWDAAVPSYAIAPALSDLPAGAIQPLEFVSRVAGGGTTSQAVIRARVDELYIARRGSVFAFADRSTKAVAEFKSADELWKAFGAGACWTDASAGPVVVSVARKPEEPTDHKKRWSVPQPAVVPPLLTGRA